VESAAVGRARLLSYDATNFYTFVASTNDRNTIARRGHNKQGRHNLRQVGLSYVLDGTSGLSLYHHVYPGNLTDTRNLDVPAPAVAVPGRQCIVRDSVTLVFDKGAAPRQHARLGSVRGRLGVGPAWNQPAGVSEMPSIS